MERWRGHIRPQIFSLYLFNGLLSGCRCVVTFWLTTCHHLTSTPLFRFMIFTNTTFPISLSFTYCSLRNHWPTITPPILFKTHCRSHQQPQPIAPSLPAKPSITSFSDTQKPSSFTANKFPIYPSPNCNSYSQSISPRNSAWSRS